MLQTTRPPNGRRGRRHNGGFTVIEIICALTILVVGVFGVFVLLTTSVQVDAESQHYATARAAAQQQLESARIQDFEQLESVRISGSGMAALVPLSTSLPPGGAETLTVSSFNGQLDTDQVTVTISWPEPGRGANNIKMSTLIVRGGLSGQ